MTKKGITIVLAIACVLSVVGAALAAATAWLSGAEDPIEETITTGEAITMTLTKGTNSNEPLYPNESATITVSADNKGYDAKLTVVLSSDDEIDVEEWESYFTIECDLDEEGADGVFTIEANEEGPQIITLTITLVADAPVGLAEKEIKVTISLDKAAA